MDYQFYGVIVKYDGRPLGIMNVGLDGNICGYRKLKLDLFLKLSENVDQDTFVIALENVREEAEQQLNFFKSSWDMVAISVQNTKYFMDEVLAALNGK